MFDQPEQPEEKQPTDYSGLKIVAALAPVLLLFAYFDKADMGLTVTIVLGLTALVIKLNWKLRRHVWFWAIIIFILALHVPLLSIGHIPQTKTPLIVYLRPIGIVDFLLMQGAIALARNFFSDSSADDEEEVT